MLTYKKSTNHVSPFPPTRLSHTAELFISTFVFLNNFQTIKQLPHYFLPHTQGDILMWSLPENLYGARPKVSFPKSRPFKCSDPECSASFTQRAHLLRHEAQHSGSQAHVCKECGTGFSRRYILPVCQVGPFSNY